MCISLFRSIAVVFQKRKDSRNGLECIQKCTAENIGLSGWVVIAYYRYLLGRTGFLSKLYESFRTVCKSFKAIFDYFYLVGGNVKLLIIHRFCFGTNRKRKHCSVLLGKHYRYKHL